MKLEGAESLLSALDQYITTDIFIFYHAVKIPFKGQLWDKVKVFREMDIDVPEDHIRRKGYINAKIITMFNIEMETRNEEYKLGNRKLYAMERAAKLLLHLQTGQSLVFELRFNDAIRQANKVWEHMKENGKKDEQKEDAEIF
jgi:hypothetical protein